MKRKYEEAFQAAMAEGRAVNVGDINRVREELEAYRNRRARLNND